MHDKLIEAALDLLLSFSRSVKILRTKLYDSKITPLLDQYLLSNNTSIQNKALRIAANLVMVFSPMRDSYIDKTSLLLLQNSFQLDDICEINCNVLLVFMNLAYWSSFEFARTLISVLDPVKLSVSMNSCVIQLQNSLLYSDESDIIKINKEKQENCIKFLLNLIGFLQNTLFERYQIDELFYEFNVLFFEVLTLLLPHKSLKLSCLQLLQNCCCGAVTRVQIIKNKDLMECFLQNMENNDFIIKIVTLQIVNYMIAFGESGSQERLSILKNYGVPKYLTRIINFASIKENNVRFPEECSQLIVLAKDIFEFFC